MTLRVACVSLLAVLVIGGTDCKAQTSMDEVAKSHIEANVPKGKRFDEYLKRDLRAYFCKDEKECSVEYELLRDGPTQTGIAYPKYYLWVKVVAGQKLTSEGAVRVAAIEQRTFDITHFLSRRDIVESQPQYETSFAEVERRGRQVRTQ